MKMQVAIDKWLEAPANIDTLVQKKNSLSLEQWTKYMHNFYHQLALSSPSKKVEYTNTNINVKADGKKDVDYLNMINDLYSSFSDCNHEPIENLK